MGLLLDQELWLVVEPLVRHNADAHDVVERAIERLKHVERCFKKHGDECAAFRCGSDHGCDPDCERYKP